MRSLFILSVFLVLILSATVVGLGLTGLITDESGRPVEGAAIIADGGRVVAVTDKDGGFELEADPGAPRRLTIKHIGFQPVMISVSDSAHVRVQLRPTVFRGQGVTVTADRAEAGRTPTAFADFTSQDIERDYFIGEMPLLLETTPNVYSYADAGGGLGYSYLKIRGFDDKRVSVYINGIPLNDPEDQATYFVDIPDFAASVKDVQVQRGIGSSLYADASFGGTVNIVSAGIEQSRSISLATGYGGFWDDGRWVGDMQKQAVEYRSGLIDGRWNFAGRYSRQLSDGYRRNSWYDGWAYQLSLSRLDPRMTTTVNVYGGPMQMHLAYYGISREQLASDRRFNPLTYDNETDNFNQPHYELHNTYELSPNASLQNTFFHIHGDGYYEQYRDDRSFADYNIPATIITNPDGDSIGAISSGDLVRQQHVRKNQWGWNPRLEFQQKQGALSIGGSFYYFESDHWGQVVWAEGITNAIDPRHRYYEYFGEKWFGSLYAVQSRRLGERLTANASLQLRHQDYSFKQNRLGAFAGYAYDIDWTFLSPRLGFSYALTPAVNLLASYSLSSRVPADWEIYDAGDPYAFPSLQIKAIRRSGSDSTIVFGDPTAQSERVHNFELGLNWRTQSSAHTVNLFWMDFANEIVPYGGLNDLGLPITTNADRSVHAGIELSTTNAIGRILQLTGNFSYNYNRIRDFAVAEAVYDNDTDWNYLESRSVSYDGKKIPGFPEYIGNLIAEYRRPRFNVTCRGRMIGRIYVENDNVRELSIDPYFVAAVSAGITLGEIADLGRLELAARVDNVLDHKYEVSGYGGATRFRDVPDQHWSEYIPAAGRSLFTTLRLELE